MKVEPHEVARGRQANIDTRPMRIWGPAFLSFVPTLLKKDHHRKDGKCFEGKEPIDFVTRTEAMGISRLSGGDSLEPKRRQRLKQKNLRNF